MKRAIYSFLVAMTIAWLLACGGAGNTSDDAAKIQGTASDDLQQQRRELIGKLQDRQIIQKIETPGTDPRVYVLPAFFALTFDQKQSFINVCYAYAYKLPKGDVGSFNEPMWIYDAMTNKKVGAFQPSTGLDLD